jgi:hypothetical protein
MKMTTGKHPCEWVQPPEPQNPSDPHQMSFYRPIRISLSQENPKVFALDPQAASAFSKMPG